MSVQPMVSVCMATFNGVPFVEEQINSILSQLTSKDELIISDNGSTDGTLEIVQGLQDARVRLLHCKKPGPVANFENALLAARGDLFVLSDQDDVWLPGRLQAALRALGHSDLSIVGLIPTDSQLNALVLTPPLPSYSLLNTFISNGYVGCAMAFRKSVRDACLPFPQLIPMHDWWIALIGLLRFKVEIDPTAYILYRRHDGNVTSIKNRWRVSILQKIKWRVALLLSLMKRLRAKN